MLACGFNGYGELGVGSTSVTSFLTPVKRSSASQSKGIVQVAASASSTSILYDDGSVETSGAPSKGALFTPNARLANRVVHSIAVTGLELVAATAQEVHILPLVPAAQPRLLSLPSGESSFGRVWGGSLFSVVECLPSGRLYATGFNNEGCLGIGRMEEGSLVAGLHPVAGCPFPVKDVSLGGGHALALLVDGSVYGWGLNTDGQLPCLQEDVVWSAQRLPLSFGVTAIGCGDFHSLLYTTAPPQSISMVPVKEGDGAVEAPSCSDVSETEEAYRVPGLLGCGRWRQGQLGLVEGDLPEHGLRPIDVPAIWRSSLLQSPVHRLRGGGGHNSSHSAILFKNGTAVMLGSNTQGQLGNGEDGSCHTAIHPNIHKQIQMGVRPKEVGMTLGWRTTFFFHRKFMPMLDAPRPLAQPSGSLCSLSSFVQDLILQFVPMKTAMVMMRVNRQWQEVVRCCESVWAPWMRKICPFTLQLEEERRAAAAMKLEAVHTDWQSLVQSSKRGKLGCCTFYPMPQKETVSSSDNGGGVLATMRAALRDVVDATSSLGDKTLRMLKLRHPNNTRVIMHGLDAGGKTTILYRIQLGETGTLIPTIGNVETIEHKNVTFTCWDVAGADKVRPLWQHYYRGTNGHIFVIDASDTDRINDAIEELLKTRSRDTIGKVPVLILANKQDLPNVKTPEEIAAAIHSVGTMSGLWCVQGCIGTTGEGVFEGLDWLSWAVEENSRVNGIRMAP